MTKYMKHESDRERRRDVPLFSNIIRFRRIGRAEFGCWWLIAAAVIGGEYHEVAAEFAMASGEITRIFLWKFIGSLSSLTVAILIAVPLLFDYIFGFPPFTYTFARRRGVRGPDDVLWATREPIPPTVVIENLSTNHFSVGGTVPGASSDWVEAELRRSASDSALVKRASLRRASVHLFVGTLVGFLGIVAFLVWEESLLAGKQPAFGPMQLAQWKALLSVPRISLLVVIEVLAGYFLRQYRIAMLDYRYFEEIYREREALVVSFLLRRDHSNNPAMAELAAILAVSKRREILSAGETSLGLESVKTSANDFVEVANQIVSPIKDLGASLVKPSGKE